MQCRLILDGSAGGTWNMAVDEALLETALTGEAIPVLRWYRWSEPTLSLGYFQCWRDRPTELSLLPAVRRITGGGAILHDAERTYALVLPAGTWPAKDHRQVVEQFHRAAAEYLEGRVLTSADAPAGAAGEFLCFHRRSPNDVVRGGSKLMGSAQRNRRGALLQHGSIVSEAIAAGEQIDSAVAAKVAQDWGWSLVPSQLSEAEQQRARQLEVEKYAAASWNQRR